MPLFCLFVLLTSLSLAHAQPAPGDVQDAEAAREKILKASDQIDMIQGNTESTKTEVEAMKGDVGKLQDENSSLKQQLAALQAAFDKSQADHEKENQVLLDEVAKMVASGKTGSAASTKKKLTPAPTEATAETAPSDSAPADKPTDAPVSKPMPADATTEATPPPAPKPQKGYYHTVEAGETLTLIVTAYRAQGVKVTIAQVRKANDLTEKTVLKVGQKLFIPKPGA